MKYKDYIPDYKLYNGNNKNLMGSVINTKNINQNLNNYGNNNYNAIPINVNINQNRYENETNNSFHLNQVGGNLFGEK